MVLRHNLQDIFEDSSKLSTFTLPTYKGNLLEIQFSHTDNAETIYSAQAPPLPFADSDLIYTNLCEWRRLTAKDESCKSVYEVTFDIKDSNLMFKPGDTIGILPHNQKQEVNAIIEHLKLGTVADLQYSLNLNKNHKGGKIPLHIPLKSTIRHVLTACCDIRTILKKLFLLALSKYTKDENERRVLEYLCSKEGSTAYTTHVLNKHLCLLDLFAIFPTCKPPIEVLFAYLPRLLPRPYSIVNSGHNNPDVLKICFSVMELSGKKRGLVTGWLEQIILNGISIEDKIQALSINNNFDNIQIPIYLRKNMSGFSSPKDLETPMLLIGPGTGVAPFIGFLEERQHLKEKNPERKLGAVWLFFGCRNPELDNIYKTELNAYLNNEILSKLITSFSRVENRENKYIQDALVENGENVVKVMKQNAIIYVCGDLRNMTTKVKETLVNCLVKHDGKSQQEAEKYLANLQAEKRYLIDAWS